MDEDLPAVLLMGGGEGMGPIEATARALGNSLYDENAEEPVGQVLIICGRNKKLANKLASIEWKIPVQVLQSSGTSNHYLAHTRAFKKFTMLLLNWTVIIFPYNIL